MDKFEDLAIQASHILEVVENYQWSLGQLSNEVVQTFGYKALEDFSKKIESIGGVRRSPASLRLYAHVYKISDQLGLPKDILFSCCREITFSNDPVKYAKLAQSGMSGYEIKKLIYQEKYA